MNGGDGGGVNRLTPLLCELVGDARWRLGVPGGRRGIFDIGGERAGKLKPVGADRVDDKLVRLGATAVADGFTSTDDSEVTLDSPPAPKKRSPSALRFLLLAIEFPLPLPLPLLEPASLYRRSELFSLRSCSFAFRNTPSSLLRSTASCGVTTVLDWWDERTGCSPSNDVREFECECDCAWECECLRDADVVDRVRTGVGDVGVPYAI